MPLKHRIYTVILTGNLDFILSGSYPATLTLLIDPVIVQQPLTQPALTGVSVTLSVSVPNTATLPINYRWRRGGFTFTNFYLNSRVSFLTLTNIQVPNTNWSVFVTNVAKPTGIASSNAYLGILTDTNANGLPDAWEAAYGFGPGNSALRDGDPDEDGMINWQEYIAGTNPTNGLSYLKIDSLATGAGATITFSAISNRTYTVYFTDALTTPWSKLADFPARPNNHVEVAVDPLSTTNRFYRLATPQQP